MLGAAEDRSTRVRQRQEKLCRRWLTEAAFLAKQQCHCPSAITHLPSLRENKICSSLLRYGDGAGSALEVLR